MTRPAKRNHIEKINKTLTQQSWLLFIIIMITIIVDVLFIKDNMLWAKSFASGAVLNFISQYVVTKVTFRYTGYKARQHMVTQFYLGAICRWILTIVGFIIIFKFLQPQLTPIILLGYFSIQISNIYLLGKIK